MPRVGEAWYEINARDEGLVRALGGAEAKAKSTGRAIEGAIDGPGTAGFDKAGASATRFGGVMGGVTKTTGKFGGVMSNLGMGVLQGVGIGAFMGVTAAAGVMVEGFGRAISSASDLSETLSKAKVVFGDRAADLISWSEGAATAMGMSQNAALGAAATYGNLFVSLGLATDESANMSQGLVQLAGDLASFNNVDPTEALDALRSGLVGETEPLKRFGINLNEATLSQKALEMGLISTTKGTLPAAAKAQAAYALIVEQSATAQGDFARTSDGLANQQRIASARMEDAMARLGQSILPIAQEIMPLLAEGAIAIVDGIGVVIRAVQDWIAANQPLIDILRTVAEIYIAAMIEWLKLLVTIVMNVAGVIGEVFSGLFEIVRGVIAGMIGAIRNFMEIAAQIPGPWQEGAAAVAQTLAGMEDSVEAWGSNTSTLAGKAADDTVRNVAAGLEGGAGTVADAAAVGMTDPMTGAMEQGNANAVEIAGRTPTEAAAALRDKRTAWQQSLDLLKSDMENKMSEAAEIAKLKGALSGQQLKNGLKSKDPVVRAQAEATKKIMTDRLAELEREARRRAARIAAALPAALEASRKRTIAAVSSIASSYAQYMYTSSPAERGAFSKDGGPEHWGEKIGAGFIRGTHRSLQGFDLRFGGSDRQTRSRLTGIAEPLVQRSGSRSWTGDIVVHVGDGIGLVNGGASRAGGARDIGRIIGEEIRYTLTRGPGLFALDGT